MGRTERSLLVTYHPYLFGPNHCSNPAYWFLPESLTSHARRGPRHDRLRPGGHVPLSKNVSRILLLPWPASREVLVPHRSAIGSTAHQPLRSLCETPTIQR